MTRKKKLDVIDVEIPKEEFEGDLQTIFKGRFDEYQFRQHLRHLEEEFKEEKNPLSAWQALLVAREHRKPVPEWVLQYLAKSAEWLFTFRKGRPPGKGETAGHVLAALGMDSVGKGNVFTRFYDSRDRETVVKAVFREIKKDPTEDWTEIYTRVADQVEAVWEGGREEKDQVLRQYYTQIAKSLKAQGKGIPSHATIKKWFEEHRRKYPRRIYRSKPS